MDVYSFGILMWVLVMASDEVYDRKIPRQRIENNVMIDNIRPKVPEWIDPRWKKLMEQCRAGEACERPSFEEISCTLHQMMVNDCPVPNSNSISDWPELECKGKAC